MITMQGITKRYEMGDTVVMALDGIDLNIKAGEFVAIIGPSGSGKSTLMNIIGCLDSATQGSYTLDGTHIEEYAGSQLADIRNKKIGFVFQQFNLLSSLNAIENIEVPLTYAGLPKKQRVARAKEMLELVGLGDRMYHKPTELSGGQQQRVSVARALSGDPAIILADEPTGALDQKTGKELLELFCSLNDQGKTVIMITHDNTVASYAKRIVTIEDGKILTQQLNPTQLGGPNDV